MSTVSLIQAWNDNASLVQNGDETSPLLGVSGL